MTAHLRLISTTTEPIGGDGNDWSDFADGDRFGQQLVRDADSAGVCVPCFITGNDLRHCRGEGCRNQTSTTTEKENH